MDENKDQTLEKKERQEEKETSSEETQEETQKETSQKELEQTLEPKVDWEQKFKDSQEGGIKSAKELKEFKEKWQQITPILSILQDNPDIMEQVDSIYQETAAPKASSKVIESLVDKKVQESLAPYRAEIETDKETRVKTAFDSFVKKYPDATKKWAEIERLLPAFKNAGYPIEEALEKGYMLTNIDEAKKAGKKELAIGLFQKEQVSIAGGSSGSQGEKAIPQLTKEQKKVAKSLGIKEEDYIKNIK